jgi:predicted DNA-binding protein (UPF0278 family)
MMTNTDLINTVLKLAQKCDNESNIDRKIRILYKINSLVPKKYQLNIPSLLTDDYIDTALFRIYQSMQISEPRAHMQYNGPLSDKRS